MLIILFLSDTLLLSPLTQIGVSLRLIDKNKLDETTRITTRIRSKNKSKNYIYILTLTTSKTKNYSIKTQHKTQLYSTKLTISTYSGYVPATSSIIVAATTRSGCPACQAKSEDSKAAASFSTGSSWTESAPGRLEKSIVFEELTTKCTR